MTDPMDSWQEFCEAFEESFPDERPIHEVRLFCEKRGYICMGGELTGYVFLKPGTEYLALTDLKYPEPTWLHSTEVEP